MKRYKIEAQIGHYEAMDTHYISGYELKEKAGLFSRWKSKGCFDNAIKAVQYLNYIKYTEKTKAQN